MMPVITGTSPRIAVVTCSGLLFMLVTPFHPIDTSSSVYETMQKCYPCTQNNLLPMCPSVIIFQAHKEVEHHAIQLRSTRSYLSRDKKNDMDAQLLREREVQE